MNKPFEMNNLRRGTVLATLGSITYLFSQWLISFLVARLSNFEAAGILSLAMTTANVFFAISGYGLRAYQVSDIEFEFTPVQYVLNRLQTVFVSILLCIVYVSILNYSTYFSIAIIVFMIYKAVEAFSDVLYGEMQRAMKLELTGISMILKGVSSIVMFLIGLTLFHDLNLSLLLMTLSVIFLTFVFDVHFTHKYIVSAFSLTKKDNLIASHLWLKGRYMLVTALIPMVMVAIPRILYEAISTELFGIYSTISTPTILISTFINCLLMPLVPLFSQWFVERNYPKFIRFSIYLNILILGFGLICFIGGKILGSWALALFFGDRVLPYAGIFSWVIVQVICSSFASCDSLMVTAMRKTSYSAIGSICGLVITALMSRFAIENWGMLGIALTLIVAQTAQSIIMKFLMAMTFCKINREARY